GIVSERLDAEDCKPGFILDGFPRTIAQAEALDGMLADKGIALNAVIEIKAEADELVKRVINRAKESGGARADDNEEVLRKRLGVYSEQTAPLVSYYEQRGLLKPVDGRKPVVEVASTILSALGKWEL